MREFLNQARNYRVLRKDSATWSEWYSIYFSSMQGTSPSDSKIVFIHSQLTPCNSEDTVSFPAAPFLIAAVPITTGVP